MRKESGLTIVEVMVALAIVGIGVLPAIVWSMSAVRDLPRRTEKRVAADLASAVMEQATDPSSLIPPEPVMTAEASIEGKGYKIERTITSPDTSGLRTIQVTVRRASDDSEVLSLRGLR